MPDDTWYGTTAEPQAARLSVAGWLRVICRGVPLILLVSFGLVLTLLLRLIEAPLFGARRPWTPAITVGVCRVALFVLGLHYRVHGQVMKEAGAVVANHASWLDIFALNAAQRIYFVAKSEVAGWAGIGWLARATGTVFIRRDRREARNQIETFKSRLDAGHKLLFFPEGTSTDGQQVLAFKPTLFAAFFDKTLRERMKIQPVTISYQAPSGSDPRLYGWWGDMEFGPHLLTTLAAPRHGAIDVTFHPGVEVTQFKDRKALAAYLEVQVRSGLRLSDNRVT